MSRDNLDTLRAFYEAEPDGEDVLQYLDPAVELYPGIRTPDQDTRYVGHDGWKEFMVDAIGLWEAVDIEPRERLEATENRILAIDNWLFRGRDGIEIERELPTLFTFRDGLIIRLDGFTDKAEGPQSRRPRGVSDVAGGDRVCSRCFRAIRSRGLQRRRGPTR